MLAAEEPLFKIYPEIPSSFRAFSLLIVRTKYSEMVTHYLFGSVTFGFTQFLKVDDRTFPGTVFSVVMTTGGLSPAVVNVSLSLRNTIIGLE